MANLDFFAARADQVALLDFLFAETDVRVFESYSAFGLELREFFSASDVERACALGEDPHGTGSAVLLQLWSSSVMDELTTRRLNLDPVKCGGHTFRHTIEGGGLIQLYFGGIRGTVLTKSHFGHNSQKRAEAWGVATGVNWDALMRLSHRIQYHIRNRLAVAKLPGRPVLEEALRLVKEGYTLKEAAGATWAYDADALRSGV